jgi:hypothetical protein
MSSVSGYQIILCAQIIRDILVWKSFKKGYHGLAVIDSDWKMRDLQLLSVIFILVVGVLGIPRPFTPDFGIARENNGHGTKLLLKRFEGSVTVHPEIARVQAVNRAYKKFSKRLVRFVILYWFRLQSPIIRDTYSAILEKHNEILRRGDNPGVAHLRKRDGSSDSELLTSPSENENDTTTGILFGNPPAVTPAVTLDEDGQDISTTVLDISDCSLFLTHTDWKRDERVPGCNGYRLLWFMGSLFKLQEYSM